MEGCGTPGRSESGSSVGPAGSLPTRSRGAGSTYGGSGKAPRCQGPTMPKPTSTSGRPLKKAPDEGLEAQGALPHGEGRALVPGRASPGAEADRAQGVFLRGPKDFREGPPTLRVDLPLRLRATQKRGGPLARAAHRERGGLLVGVGALRQRGGGGHEEAHPFGGGPGRMAHSQEAQGAGRDTP